MITKNVSLTYLNATKSQAIIVGSQRLLFKAKSMQMPLILPNGTQIPFTEKVKKILELLSINILVMEPTCKQTESEDVFSSSVSS